jgi:hypothetical protein
MFVVPSVSVGKFRRALLKLGAVDQEFVPGSYTSTSLEGLGATRPPPITYICPLKLSPLVSPVGRGIAAIVPMLLATGLKLNELVVSITVIPTGSQSDAPPT